MKRIMFAAALAVAAVPAFAGVGVSVNIGEPGFYGQIDLGDAPAPQVVYTQPVIVQQGVVNAAPIYLRVPPGYAKNWRRHCAEYNACGRPVYFVRNSWYSKQYVPYYHARHGGGPRDDHHDHEHDRGRGHHN